jgi:hypothetical protein
MAQYWYLVGNRRTGQCCDVVAASAQAACASRGWVLSDCVVIEVGAICGPDAKRERARQEDPAADRPRRGLAGSARLV